MGDRERQGRSAHPIGVGNDTAGPRPRGPIGLDGETAAEHPTGVRRFVQPDGTIAQAGSTTAETLIQLRGELTTRLNPVERIKAEAQKSVLQYLHIPSEQFAEAQEIVGMTRAALGGSATAAVGLAVTMLMAGVEAMQAGQKVRDCVCAAHTFGYWVFSHLGLSAPDQPPAQMHRSDVEEDNRGNYDRISAELLATRWQQCHRDTIHRLNRSQDIRSVRNDLQQSFQGMDLRSTTNDEILRLFKVMVLAPEFTQDPRSAASVFFLSTIQNLPTVERRVATILYRRHPYAPDV